MSQPGNPYGVTPQVIDLLAVTDGYIVPPRTTCYGLLFNDITDIGIRFRFREGTPWIVARSGHFYDFRCLPIQTGILLDVSTSIGPTPNAVAVIATVAGSLEVA